MLPAALCGGTREEWEWEGKDLSAGVLRGLQGACWVGLRFPHTSGTAKGGHRLVVFAHAAAGLAWSSSAEGVSFSGASLLRKALPAAGKECKCLQGVGLET